MEISSRLIGSPLGSGHCIGDATTYLESTDIDQFLVKITGSVDVAGKSVTLVIPDSTRSCPILQILEPLYDAWNLQAKSLTALIALGTHAAMSDTEIDNFVFKGSGTWNNRFPNMPIVNHEWWKPVTFSKIGVITEEQMLEISLGRLVRRVHILVNRLITDSDLVITIGPVFPHEVVGFSGGTKYLFPGVSGKEMIDASHWLGALISSSEIIGTLGVTPVREMINFAASHITTEILSLCLVVQTGTGNIHALSFGAPHTAWESAAAISSQTHIAYVEKPYQRVISIIPNRYTDIWTAAKGMYKVEPVVADGGEVIIYAPHVTEFAYSHKELEEIGYHCRAYFTEQWDKFKHFPTGLLAHSTHLRGAGTFTEADGENCRITVTLATGISESRTRAMNLSYLDPALLQFSDYASDE
ncbi:MAG: lactate racemase domain-containing protein, partial [Candidatus Nanopelagicaceae bacterium]